MSFFDQIDSYLEPDERLETLSPSSGIRALDIPLSSYLILSSSVFAFVP